MKLSRYFLGTCHILFHCLCIAYYVVVQKLIWTKDTGVLEHASNRNKFTVPPVNLPVQLDQVLGYFLLIADQINKMVWANVVFSTFFYQKYEPAFVRQVQTSFLEKFLRFKTFLYFIHSLILFYTLYLTSTILQHPSEPCPRLFCHFVSFLLNFHFLIKWIFTKKCIHPQKPHCLSIRTQTTTGQSY